MNLFRFNLKKIECLNAFKKTKYSYLPQNFLYASGDFFRNRQKLS